MSSQSLLDRRGSKASAVGRLGRVELMVDVLNALGQSSSSRCQFALLNQEVSAVKFKPNTAFLVMAFAAACAACDDRRPTLTGPSPTAAPPAVAGVSSVTGTVLSTVYRPLRGARVEVTSGPTTGLSTVADDNGRFQLAGSFDATSRFRATHDGYAQATEPLPLNCQACNLSMFLESLEPPVDIAGMYSATFVADSTCSALPAEARTRSYHAVIAKSGLRFEVVLSGATFLGPYSRFLILVAGSDLKAFIGNQHGTPGIVEEVTPNTSVTFDGVFTATVSNTETIAGEFAGTIDHCVRGPSNSCGAALASCDSIAHRLTLTRSRR